MYPKQKNEKFDYHFNNIVPIDQEELKKNISYFNN